MNRHPAMPEHDLTPYDCEPPTTEDIARERAATNDLRQWQMRTLPTLWTCPRCKTDHRHGTPSDEYGCVDCGYRQETQ